MEREIQAKLEENSNKVQLFRDFFPENGPLSGNRTLKGEEKLARSHPRYLPIPIETSLARSMALPDSLRDTGPSSIAPRTRSCLVHSEHTLASHGKNGSLAMHGLKPLPRLRSSSLVSPTALQPRSGW